MKTETLWPVEWFEVIAVSEDFLDVIKDFPEASTASSITIDEKTIEGAKTVLLADSIEQIEQNMPSIVANLADREHTHLRIIQRSTNCSLCWADKQKGKELTPCTHNWGTVNRAFNIDITEYL